MTTINILRNLKGILKKITLYNKMTKLRLHASRKKIYKLKEPYLDKNNHEKIESIGHFDGFYYAYPIDKAAKERGNYIYSLKFKKNIKTFKINSIKALEDLSNYTYSYLYNKYDNIEYNFKGDIFGVIFNIDIVKEFKLYAKKEKYNYAYSRYELV